MWMSPCDKDIIYCFPKDATILGAERSDLLEQIAVDLNL
jgi:hypothetical protein